jgi:D-alanine-D-alanine ligase
MRSRFTSAGSSQLPEQLKVAVLMGGPGREREVSIQSGQYVTDALKQAGVNVVTADIKPDHLDILDDHSIDVFFVALHGTFGEDGQLQEILESKGLVYTGSGPQASRLAFDKWESKKIFTRAGITTPKSVLFEPRLKLPAWQKYVVKPLREGSTIGITITDNPAETLAAAEKCAAEFGDCMLEEFVPGKEITVGVLGKDALPILEIRATGGFYDYQAKYLDDKTQYLFDTISDSALTAKIQKSAIDCFNALGCRGAARVDFILSAPGETSPLGGDNAGVPYVLEINTIPGMTSHSLLPKAAAKAGIPMSKLCLKMVELAMADAAVNKTAVKRR